MEEDELVQVIMQFPLLYTPSVLCLVHDFFATKLIFFLGLCSP